MHEGKNKDKWLWIFQQTKAEIPWAVRVHGMKRGRRRFYNAEIYAEWIPNAAQKLILRNSPFHVLRMKNDASGYTECVLTELPGIVSDVCELYGGEVGPEDRKFMRRSMQALYKGLK